MFATRTTKVITTVTGVTLQLDSHEASVIAALCYFIEGAGGHTNPCNVIDHLVSALARNGFNPSVESAKYTITGNLNIERKS